ncbi:IniB N-terminal domain-containing protein [Microbacterium sp. NPDC076911]|uniref:IniB N-terminal domain-containing protein n=1 Tax=Microbacterium sp. NPDC076911 TaxID=3154958 RepID=UPI00341DC4B7
MSTPLATVANAIIDFILSLLRDPEALAQFEQDPEGTLASNGLDCVDVSAIRAAAPVVYDRPEVAVKQVIPPASTHHNEIVREYSNMAQTFTWLDNRATIVDQSTNQNIWTEGGDVDQVFDQVAGVASGDAALAAGDDIGVVGGTNTNAPQNGVFSTGDTATPLSPEAAAELANGADAADLLPADGEDPSGVDAADAPADQAVLDETLLEGLPEDAAGQVSDAVDTATEAYEDNAATVPAVEPEAAAAEAAGAEPAAPQAAAEPAATEPVAEYVEPVAEYVEPVVEYVEPAVEESDWDAGDGGMIEDDGLYEEDMTGEQ